MKCLRNRKAEGYTEVCVGVLVFALMTVLVLNLFRIISLRFELERIGEELMDVASYTGCFGDDFDAVNEGLQETYYEYGLSYGADTFFNATAKTVQLGDRMHVTVSVKSSLQGFGVKIPVTVSCTKNGISEHYWK